MAMYERKALESEGVSQGVVRDQAQLSTFIKQTYQLFAASLLAGSAGAYAGLGMIEIISKIYWILFIAQIGLIFALQAARKKEGLNLMLLFAFTFISGLTLAPMIGMFLSRGAGDIVAQAFLLTTVAFGGLSVFAMNTKKDFTTMGKMLFITLIVVVVAGVINIFMQSPIFQIAIASVSAILFSAFILYDTQNIIRGAYETPIQGAIALYIDFLNLFVALLQILGIFGGSDE